MYVYKIYFVKKCMVIFHFWLFSRVPKELIFYNVCKCSHCIYRRVDFLSFLLCHSGNPTHRICDFNVWGSLKEIKDVLTLCFLIDWKKSHFRIQHYSEHWTSLLCVVFFTTNYIVMDLLFWRVKIYIIIKIYVF